MPVRPHAIGPLPVLAQRPAQAIEHPNGDNQLHVLPIAAADFKEQKPQVEPQVLNGRAVVAKQPAETRVGVKIRVLRLEGSIERQKHLWEMVEQE